MTCVRDQSVPIRHFVCAKGVVNVLPPNGNTPRCFCTRHVEPNAGQLLCVGASAWCQVRRGLQLGLLLTLAPSVLAAQAPRAHPWSSTCPSSVPGARSSSMTAPSAWAVALRVKPRQAAS